MANRADYDRRVLDLFDGYVHGNVTRRQFLDRAAAFTATGVSAATLLASLSPDYSLAQQVDPGDTSISTGYKKYASPNGAGVMQGYYARPAVVDHKLPGVVVIHENRGLNPYIEDVARRLAVAGFIAFAPDALTPLGGYPGNDDEGRAMQRDRDSSEMVEDFVAAVAFLQEHPDCTGTVGSVGFCFGGEMSLRLAVRIANLGAAVAFYGRHPSADDAAKIRAPLMLHHAELDERVNATWPAFEEALQDNELDYINNLYADVNHGFHNDTTPRFDENAAALAWQRTIEHFSRHLIQDA
ncbi:MAG: dienelactone hydrolase family protein [Gammaproteobacteria bacterium]|nr:dienelactone hydrolase family protein [Gammaproteobacteria bacterium]MDH3749425.1 dienelactone hydrolase family protein [Gammaproteobacteria bacterium]